MAYFGILLYDLFSDMPFGGIDTRQLFPFHQIKFNPVVDVALCSYVWIEDWSQILYSGYRALVTCLNNFWNCCHCPCTAFTLFVRLTVSPCLSNWSRHISSSFSTAVLDVSHSTWSSANSMAEWDSVVISEGSTSMMMMKRSGSIDAGPLSHQNTLYFLPLSQNSLWIIFCYYTNKFHLVSGA